MNRRPIFTGPNYPPESVMRCILGLTINITSRDFIVNTVAADNDQIIPALAYITNLNTSSDGITFTAVCANPVTRDVVKTTTEDRTIHITRKPGMLLPRFSGGETTYNISPCCVVMTYPPEESTIKTNLEISCKSPLTANVVGDTVEVSILDGLEATSVDIEETQPQTRGVKAINGLLTTNGGIDIHGVGSVTVTVLGADIVDGGENV